MPIDQGFCGLRAGLGLPARSDLLIVQDRQAR